MAIVNFNLETAVGRAQLVCHVVSQNISIHAGFLRKISGQLPFLGLKIRFDFQKKIIKPDLVEKHPAPSKNTQTTFTL
jgi:hypothetical protein